MSWDSDETQASPGREIEWLDLCPVYDAQDEPDAIHVRTLLCSAGLEARIRSAQIPCFDGAIASAVGYWGQVVVPRRQVLEARALIEAFQRESGESAT